MMIIIAFSFRICWLVGRTWFYLVIRTRCCCLLAVGSIEPTLFLPSFVCTCSYLSWVDERRKERTNERTSEKRPSRRPSILNRPIKFALQSRTFQRCVVVVGRFLFAKNYIPSGYVRTVLVVKEQSGLGCKKGKTSFPSTGGFPFDLTVLLLHLQQMFLFLSASLLYCKAGAGSSSLAE